MDVANPFMSDPFALLRLEPTFFLDSKVLEKAYFEAQRKAHPDQFAQASPEVKAQAASHSTAINQAYLLLKDPLKRATILLEQAGVEPLSSDPAFLAQVMEWGEAQEDGQDLSHELKEQEALFLQELTASFMEKNYEMANSYVYRVTYINGLLK